MSFTTPSSLLSLSSQSRSSMSLAATETSASYTSSMLSEESASLDLSFLTENQQTCQQLLADLSIVDDFDDLIQLDPDIESYEKQMIDTARFISLKETVLDQLLKAESDYIDQLSIFYQTFSFTVQPWLSKSNDKDILTRFKPFQSVFEDQLRQIHAIIQVHINFFNHLKERALLWGPTQFISDIFVQLRQEMKVYIPYIKQHNNYIMAIDTLYKNTAFDRFIEPLMQEMKSKTPTTTVHDHSHFLQLPLLQFNQYKTALKQFIRYTDQTHPDYTNLSDTFLSFRAFDKEWTKKVQDCRAHLAVFEAYRSIQNCPIQVTPQRRMLLSGQLIRVDLDDITSTSDTRMYFLFNDNLIYCKKKQKENKKDPTDTRWIYKGTLSLRGADVRQFAPSFCAKMCEEKKSIFRLKRQTEPSQVPTEAFGFEVVATELNLDAMSPLHQNYMSASAGSVTFSKKRHLIRTQSKQEQATWFDTIRKAIQIINAKPS